MNGSFGSFVQPLKWVEQSVAGVGVDVLSRARAGVEPTTARATDVLGNWRARGGLPLVRHPGARGGAMLNRAACAAS
jgi:hypothetical protein